MIDLAKEEYIRKITEIPKSLCWSIWVGCNSKNTIQSNVKFKKAIKQKTAS